MRQIAASHSSNLTVSNVPDPVAVVGEVERLGDDLEFLLQGLIASALFSKDGDALLWRSLQSGVKKVRNLVSS
jgi:hypothetical protein